jgi:hypothetical protein
LVLAVLAELMPEVVRKTEPMVRILFFLQLLQLVVVLAVVLLVRQIVLEMPVALAVEATEILQLLVEHLQQIKVLQAQVFLQVVKVVEVEVLAKLATLMVQVKVEMVYQQTFQVRL